MPLLCFALCAIYAWVKWNVVYACVNISVAFCCCCFVAMKLCTAFAEIEINMYVCNVYSNHDIDAFEEWHMCLGTFTWKERKWAEEYDKRCKDIERNQKYCWIVIFFTFIHLAHYQTQTDRATEDRIVLFSRVTLRAFLYMRFSILVPWSVLQHNFWS